MIVQIVRFKSGLSAEDVRSTFEVRAPLYRDVAGLVQKLYLELPEAGEFGAVLLWDSRESLESFRESQLARTIPQVYRIAGSPRVEIAEVVMALRPELTQAAP